MEPPLKIDRPKMYAMFTAINANGVDRQIAPADFVGFFGKLCVGWGVVGGGWVDHCQPRPTAADSRRPASRSPRPSSSSEARPAITLYIPNQEQSSRVWCQGVRN